MFRYINVHKYIYKILKYNNKKMYAYKYIFYTIKMAKSKKKRWHENSVNLFCGKCINDYFIERKIERGR